MFGGIEILGWLKSSFIDYPGTVSTVLFLSGCNLRCPYCHNPGIVLGQYGSVPFDDIRAHIIKRKGVIDGVVISGGEPSLHKGLKGLCDELRSHGLKIKIDTNGLLPERIIECRPDYLALDIKTSFEKYPRLGSSSTTSSSTTSSSSTTTSATIPLISPTQSIRYDDYRERLRMSINIARSMGQNAEVRITAAPGVIDGDDIDVLCVELRGINKLFIQQFNADNETLDPAYSSTKPYGPDELERWRRKFIDAGIDCHIRGC